MKIFWNKVLSDEPFNVSEITYHLDGKGISILKDISRGHFSRLVRLDMDLWRDMSKVLDFNQVFLNPTFTERMYRSFEDEILGDDVWSKKFCLYCPFAPKLQNEIPKKLHKFLTLNGKKEGKLSHDQLLIKAEVDSMGVKLSPEKYVKRSMICKENLTQMDEIFAKTIDIEDFEEYKDKLNSKQKLEFEDILDDWYLLSQNPMFEYQENYVDMTGFCGNPNITEKFIKTNKGEEGFDELLFSSNPWLRGKKIDKYEDLINDKGFVYNHYAPPETFTSRNYLNSYDITNRGCKKKTWTSCKDRVFNPAIPFSFFF